MRFIRSLAFTAAGLVLTAQAHAGIYYFVDNVFPAITRIDTDTGQTRGGFYTAEGATAPAIRETIWLGHSADWENVEFTLDGHGINTSHGNRAFHGLADGATGTDGKNYGVFCCIDSGYVTVANADWTNQRVLFDSGAYSTAIAFDPKDRTLYLSSWTNTTVRHFDLDGRLLNTFDLGQSLWGLAYDQAQDAFWGFNKDTVNLVQFNRVGTVLREVPVPLFDPTNSYGGEMQVLPVPEPGTLLLAAAGLPLLAAVAARRRRRRD